MDIEIFQRRQDRLRRVEQADTQRPFSSEKAIQELIERNIGTVFPGLTFVDHEFSLGSLRIDTVAFDNLSRSFVIIEYKNTTSRGAPDQGRAYLHLLKTKYYDFVFLLQKMKGKKPDINNIQQNNRVIIIAPDYSSHELDSYKTTLDPIELYRIGKFEESVIVLEKIPKTETGLHSGHTHRKPQKTIVSSEYSEGDYLAGKYPRSVSPSKNATELFHAMKRAILDNIDDVEIIQKKLYTRFYASAISSTICTISVTKNGLKLCYTTKEKNIFPKSPFVRHMVDSDGQRIDHHGLGDYISKIKAKSDIDKALPLIKKVYSSIAQKKGISVPTTNTSRKPQPKPSYNGYTEEGYLSGEYTRGGRPYNKNSIELFHAMKNAILDSMNDLKVIQKKYYVRFVSTNGHTICTVELADSGLKVCYTTDKKNIFPESSFVRHMISETGKKIGHYGLGDYMSKIKNKSDIDKAIPLIKTVYGLTR